MICMWGCHRYVKGALSRSLTVRNLQLSLYGLPLSLAYMWVKDGGGSANFRAGFGITAWAVVGLQARIKQMSMLPA